MKKISILVLSTLFAFVCCTPQIGIEPASTDPESPVVPDDPQGKDGDVMMDILLSVPPIEIEPQTKSAMSSAGAFTWDANDKVGFWPSPSNVRFGTPQQCIYTVMQSAAGRECATFHSNGWGLMVGNTYYNYYPYDETATNSSVGISYKNQNQTSNGSATHLGSYDYLRSYFTMTGGGQVVEMNHLGSVVRLVLTFDSEYSSVSMTDVEIRASSSLLVESATYNPCAQSISLANKVTKNTMQLSLNSGNGFTPDANNQLVLYLMMSPAAWSGSPVTVTVRGTDRRSFVGEFTPAANQVAGQAYTYAADMRYTANVFDLSSLEPANCYMVSEAGNYKFKAVKGNTNLALSVTGAEVLWESVGTTTAPAVGSIIKPEVTYGDGYIFFSTADTFKKGNAVIVAKNGSDIVWSWHIWCTENPDRDEYCFDAGYLMDRNLGALSASGNLSSGLYYQWGRKDPFPGTASISSASQSKTTLGTFPSPVDSDSSKGTVAYSISHPTTIIKGSHQLDWMRDYDTSERTWYAAGGGKTMYDPCPPGYRVPDGSTTTSSEEGRGFWAKALGFSYRSYFTNGSCSTSAGTISFSDNKMQMPIAEGKYAYYPAAGCINDAAGTMEYVGDHIFLWSNYPGGTDGTNWNTIYSGVLDVNMAADAITVNWNSGRASGKNVRCQLMSFDNAGSSSGNEGFGRQNGTW